jgi:hypothetical protein
MSSDKVRAPRGGLFQARGCRGGCRQKPPGTTSIQREKPPPPWELPGHFRLDCQPHRARLLFWSAMISLILCDIYPTVWDPPASRLPAQSGDLDPGRPRPGPYGEVPDGPPGRAADARGPRPEPGRILGLLPVGCPRVMRASIELDTIAQVPGALAPPALVPLPSPVPLSAGSRRYGGSDSCGTTPRMDSMPDRLMRNAIPDRIAGKALRREVSSPAGGIPSLRSMPVAARPPERYTEPVWEVRV